MTLKPIGLLLLAALCLPAMSQTQTPASPPTTNAEDPFLWLENVDGDDALGWVRARNAESQKVLEAQPEFAPIQAQMLETFNAKDRIPAVTRRGEWLYNLWQDESHQRGLWRRTSLAEFRKAAPAWETVLDIDALAAAEKENWVWGGSVCLGPVYRQCLVSLSRGGADAKVMREFDLVEKRFVDGGFVLPEAKSTVDWIDADTLYVGTDFGPGSMTDSGYPRVIKRWKRGTPLAEAVTVFEGQASDVSADVSVDTTPGFERTVFARSTDFYNQQRFVEQGGKRIELDLPSDASVAFWHTVGHPEDTMLLSLRSDWVVAGRRYPSGSLLAADAKKTLAGAREFTTLFAPTPTRSLAGFTTTRSTVIVDVLDQVASRLEEWHRGPSGYTHRIINAPSPGSLQVMGLHDSQLKDDALAERYLLTYTDFLTPDSLLLGQSGSDERESLKTLPAGFNSQGMRAEQAFATSKDGTRVPYFIVWPKGVDAKTPGDGSNPTLLYGYGGFEISLQPWYSQVFGKAWLARGGVFVVANIRGGGEFGPAWHKAAIMDKKQRSYDDFIAVAEDLIARKITSPKHLGIEGGSNGGLLVGATFTQRPDLFNAVLCEVPLLDMKRYHRLLAGASWMAEYGNPDVAAEWDVISRYSPYQNVKPGVKYPKVFFTTSTRDDRVHPGHARKMAARMLAQGHETLYYENIEGGHGGAADNVQRAHLRALEFSYLWKQLAR